MIDEIVSSRPLWGGITLASIGSITAAVTTDGASGVLVAIGGIFVVLYGLWSAGRDKATQDAFRRERTANDRLDTSQSELEACRLECVRLKARVDFCERNHGQARSG